MNNTVEHFAARETHCKTLCNTQKTLLRRALCGKTVPVAVCSVHPDHIYAVLEVKMVMATQLACPAAEPAQESCCMCVGSGLEVHRQEPRDSARAAVCELAPFTVI